MRSSSHLSSSTFNTGTLEAARVNPVLRRRIASSRPRRCGIETTRGADICESFPRLLHVIPYRSKKSAPPINAVQKMELYGFPFVFQPMAEQRMPTAGLGGDTTCLSERLS